MQSWKNYQNLDFQENLRTEREKELDVDQKLLSLVGFQTESQGTTRGFSTARFNVNVTNKQNFSIVSYVQAGQLAATILQIQNLAALMPMESLVIYDLGLSEYDHQSLSTVCNNSNNSNLKCSISLFDLSSYPGHIIDDRLRLFRPLIIKHALSYYRTILFTSNAVRFRGGTNMKMFGEMRKKVEEGSHVMSLEIKKLPVTTSTHPRMFEYFNTDADAFLFVGQITLDAIYFHQSKFLDDNILLPWIKCIFTPQCIQPIGANSNTNHCKFNKKPQYRYSGCHMSDESALNIVLGLAFNFNEAKYSVQDNDGPLFVKETLEESMRTLDNRKKNITETSEHPYSSSDE